MLAICARNDLNANFHDVTNICKLARPISAYGVYWVCASCIVWLRWLERWHRYGVAEERKAMIGWHVRHTRPRKRNISVSIFRVSTIVSDRANGDKSCWFSIFLWQFSRCNFLVAMSGANELKVNSYMDNRIPETPMNKNLCFTVLKSDYVDGRCWPCQVHEWRYIGDLIETIVVSINECIF